MSDFLLYKKIWTWNMKHECALKIIETKGEGKSVDIAAERIVVVYLYFTQLSQWALNILLPAQIGPDHVQVNWNHKSIGNISQLETRPLIGWSSGSTNQRPGFQLTYVSKTLAHDPALTQNRISKWSWRLCMIALCMSSRVVRLHKWDSSSEL